MRQVTVAVAQMSPLLNEVERNLDTMGALVENTCLHQQVDLFVFPELCTTGYECGVRFADLAERYLHVGGDRDFAAMNAAQEAALRGKLVDLIRLHSDCAGQILGIDSTAGTVKAAQEALRRLPDFQLLASSGQYDEIDGALSALSLRKPGNVKAQQLIDLKARIDKLREIDADLLEAVRTMGAGDLIRRVMELCEEFQRDYLDRKRSSGVLHYHDIVQMAIATLIENTELRRYYKRRFAYIMIDEFQDTTEIRKTCSICLRSAPTSWDLPFPLRTNSSRASSSSSAMRNSRSIDSAEQTSASSRLSTGTWVVRTGRLSLCQRITGASRA